MSAVPFRQGREGLYANIGEHTILVARRRDGYEVSVDGYVHGRGLGFRTAQGQAQTIATKIAEEDGLPEVGQEAHPAGDDVAEDASTTTTEESTMTTTDTTQTGPSQADVDDAVVALAEELGGVVDSAVATRRAAATKQARTAVQSAALAKANEARSAAAAAKREQKAAEKAKADRAKARGANRAEILKRHGKKESVATIATALGISQGRVRQILMDSGLVKPTSRNPERDARIVDAIDKGEDPAVVAEREGVKEFRARWIHKVAKAGAA